MVAMIVRLLLLTISLGHCCFGHESIAARVDEWDFGDDVSSDGFVNVTWQDGRAFTGQLVGSLPNGQGLLILPPRDKYECDVRNG